MIEAMQLEAHPDVPVTGVWARLCAALDGARVLEAFRRTDADRLMDGGQLDRCDVHRVHFGSGRGFVVDYTLHLRDAKGTRQLPAFGQLSERDPHTALASVARKLCSRNASWPDIADHSRLTLLPDLGMIVRPIGIDERIDDLATLATAAARGAIGARAAALAGIGHADGTVELLAHRLGKRAVLRLSARSPGGPESSILKLYKRGSKSAGHTAAVTKALLNQSCALPDRVNVPTIYSVLSHTPGLLMQNVPGRPLHELTGGLRRLGHRLAGVALAKLHRCTIDGLEPYGPDNDLHLLRRWVEFVTNAAPAWASKFTAKLAVLDSARASYAPYSPCPVHRDYHDKQIIFDGRRAGLIDFDTVCLGDPAQDIGNFIAHLRMASARSGGCSASSVEDLHEAFLAGYYEGTTASDERPSDANIEWHTRASLLRLAFISAFSDGARNLVNRLLDDI